MKLCAAASAPHKNKAVDAIFSVLFDAVVYFNRLSSHIGVRLNSLK